jgi:ribonucleoside-triphosphate reductase (formate)
MAGCGKATEVFSRITGYFRPIANWNIAKVQEFKDRKVFKNIGGKDEEDKR